MSEIQPTKSPEDSASNDVQRLVRRFWSEFMEPAELDASELAGCDPQEMALFAFLVGAGMKWDAARKAENLDILEANTEARRQASP